MEIEKSAERALRIVKRLFKHVSFDDASEDILREYLRTELTNWQRGGMVTVENSGRLAQEILTRRRNETNTFNEISGVMMTVSTYVTTAIEMMQNERDEEARKLAATMPAIKV